MGDARAVLGAQLEARHGRGVLDNASFRQFEAEYMIRFPAEDYDLAGDIVGALSSVDSLLCGAGVEAAKVGVLFVTGAAGAGKTHAVCDAAIQRLRDDALPSVVVLGEKLGSGDFWEQVRSILGFPGTVGRDELLESLDAAGETAGAPLMLFVDALNERDPRSAWKSELASIVAQTQRYQSTNPFAYV